jgi:hypothetical protein
MSGAHYEHETTQIMAVLALLQSHQYRSWRTHTGTATVRTGVVSVVLLARSSHHQCPNFAEDAAVTNSSLVCPSCLRAHASISRWFLLLPNGADMFFLTLDLSHQGPFGHHARWQATRPLAWPRLLRSLHANDQSNLGWLPNSFTFCYSILIGHCTKCIVHENFTESREKKSYLH